MPEVSLPDFPFRRGLHDRLAERRTDQSFLDDAWQDPRSRVLVMRGHHLSAGADGLSWLPPSQAPPGPRFLLGAAGGVVHFVVLAAEQPSLVDGDGFAGLRALATRLDDVSASLAVHAVALGGWHSRHQRCSVCGQHTEPAGAGASRTCPACGTTHFPRTDPAVIMLVEDDRGRCLLGNNAARARTWYSTLAGFVEPGETPEDAVAREVSEEVGIAVVDPVYVGSQPWPFPSSLMLGYVARAATTDITVDGDEITSARWFTRDELREEVESGQVVLPSTISIAGALVTRWYGAALPARPR